MGCLQGQTTLGVEMSSEALAQLRERSASPQDRTGWKRCWKYADALRPGTQKRGRGKMANWSPGLLGSELGNPGFHNLFDKRDRKWLIQWEMNGAFGGGKGFQFVFEGFDHGGGGEETEVV